MKSSHKAFSTFPWCVLVDKLQRQFHTCLQHYHPNQLVFFCSLDCRPQGWSAIFTIWKWRFYTSLVCQTWQVDNIDLIIDINTPSCMLSCLHAWVREKRLCFQRLRGAVCAVLELAFLALFWNMFGNSKSTLTFIGFLRVRSRHKCSCRWHIYVGWNPLLPGKTQSTFCREKIGPVLQRANILVNMKPQMAFGNCQ